MSDHAIYRATKHFGSLDGVRFICIMAVLWHHAPGAREFHMMTPLFARGHVGVDFFFVLSGFLITTLLLREEDRNGRFSLRGFYWRRFLRIIPVYFLVVTVAGFNAVVLNGQTEQAALLPYYYLFLTNYLTGEGIGFLDPTWSLAMEEQFYLVWPLLLILLPRRWVVPVLIGLISWNLAAVLGVFDWFGITGFTVGKLRFALVGTTFAPILMGALLAVLLHNPRGFASIAPWLSRRAMPWLMFTTLIAALALLPKVLEGWPNLLVHSLMCLCLASLVVCEDTGMARILKLPPVVRIGQISYGIYLYHLFVRGVVVPVAMALGITSVGVMFVALLVGSVLVAEISFRTYEHWFMSLRHKGPGRSKPSTLSQG
jgi:peptidoglycan/LPS O-acetylase OafA/YrhL